MSYSLRSRIVKIGNSQGIRIPKPLLEQSGIGEEVEIEVQDGCLVIRPVGRSRVGWEEAFAAMAAERDDVLLDPTVETNWDEDEWEW